MYFSAISVYCIVAIINLHQSTELIWNLRINSNENPTTLGCFFRINLTRIFTFSDLIQVFFRWFVVQRLLLLI